MSVNQELRLLLSSYPMQKAVLSAGIDLREYRHCLVSFTVQLLERLPRNAKLELVDARQEAAVRLFSYI